MLHAALLRGVNVGGNKKIAMADLRAWAEGLGFTSVKTLLKSGNLVFDSGKLAGAALEAHLEAEAGKRLGLKTDIRVRTGKEMAAIVAANPFPDIARSDPSHLVVHFLEAPLSAKAAADLQAAIEGPERVAAHGREAFMTYPDGIGTSTLKPALLTRAFGKGGTARNWNTVTKLAAMTAG